MFLAGWVHRDISTGNIIVVENGGPLRGLLSDLEYAKAASSQGSSSDPKTYCFSVKDRFFLTFDQGTPYFMPLEIHLGRKFTSYANTQLWTDEEFEKYERGDFFSSLELPEAILRYTFNHDQESLMWVALWIVYGLVDWNQAKKIWPKIFTNIRRPTQEREDFFRQAHFLVKGEFLEVFHPQLRPDYPQAFRLLRAEIYTFCMLAEPKEENYHKLFNHLSVVFNKLLTTVADKPEIVPLVVRSSLDNQTNDEVERPTPHSMRSHVQNSGAPRRRFLRQY